MPLGKALMTRGASTLQMEQTEAEHLMQRERARAKKSLEVLKLPLTRAALQFKVHTPINVQKPSKSERSHPKSFFVIGSREGEGLF